MDCTLFLYSAIIAERSKEEYYVCKEENIAHNKTLAAQLYGEFKEFFPENAVEYFVIKIRNERKGDDDMIYFTSDLHLGHRGIIGMQNRPFENVQEMNQVLIRNYNSVVHKNDTVYILGDISHHLPMDRANELISKLNGKKILVKGNHDKKCDTELFEDICDFKTVSLNGVYFALMHYPLLSWPKKNSGSIQLHGHIHAREEYNLKNREDGIRRYDVGVDANSYYPVCKTNYSYSDKQFLNEQFSKYGKYHIKEVLRTIYQMHLIILKAFVLHSDKIKQDQEFIEAYEDILKILIDLNYEQAAVILDEFRIH